jgi:hypothetical protein
MTAPVARCETPTVRVVVLSVRGRAHAALGEHREAAQVCNKRGAAQHTV